MFTLRNIVPDNISCCKDVKSLIKAQLSDDITEDDLDLGYVQGSTVVSKADLDEICEGLTKGLNNTLWCDGLPVEQTSSRKRPVSAVEHGDEAEGSKEKKRKKKWDDKVASKEDKVEEILQKLQEKYSKGFSIGFGQKCTPVAIILV